MKATRCADAVGRGVRTRCAFTLLEVMIVIVVMSILAFSVVPALSSAAGAQSAGAANEIERVLLLARAKAMATSASHAVEVDTSPSSIRLCFRDAATGTVKGVTADDGTESRAQLLSARFGNTRIRSVEIDGISTGAGTIWFAFNGVPELRNSSGVRVGPATLDARITLDDGTYIEVVARSGAVTVQPGGAP